MKSLWSIIFRDLLFLNFFCRDFYSMNVAGVVNLKPNQNVTLWIKSTSAGTWQLSEDSTFSIVLIHQENDLHASGFQAALNPSLSQTVVGATSWKIVRNWVTARVSSGAGLFKLGIIMLDVFAKVFIL